VDKTSRIAIAGVPIVLIAGLVLLGRSLPGYFSNQQYLMGLIFLQVLVVCLWFYDRLFFPFLMIAFLWAGTDVPMSEPWTSGRWLVLGAGASVGFVLALKAGAHHYRPFHMVAAFCVASAIVSAMVSEVPQLALMKAASLFLLFLYGASGARLVLRDPDRFFRGLLFACELSVYVSGFCYLVIKQEIWGNSNSLGAVEGVVAAPLLLWGALVAGDKRLQLRRALACVGALYLVYFSVTRAAMLGAAASMLVVLIGVRRHKLILKGLLAGAGVVAITAIAAPGHFDELNSSLVSGVIYKGQQEQGLLGSRLTPWQETLRVIQDKPYFGSGFGTSFAGDKPFGEIGRLASTADLREHGSSYLAIVEWVGLLGILPFLLLLLVMVRAIARVFAYLRRTGNVAHYSVPLMMVMVAGLVHAGFEDWMFAVGYYLTVLFWSLAFLLMDLMPEPAAHQAGHVHGVRFRYATSAAVTRP